MVMGWQECARDFNDERWAQVGPKELDYMQSTQGWNREIRLGGHNTNKYFYSFLAKKKKFFGRVGIIKNNFWKGNIKRQKIYIIVGGFGICIGAMVPTATTYTPECTHRENIPSSCNFFYSYLRIQFISYERVFHDAWTFLESFIFLQAFTSSSLLRKPTHFHSKSLEIA